MVGDDVRMADGSNLYVDGTDMARNHRLDFEDFLLKGIRGHFKFFLAERIFYISAVGGDCVLTSCESKHDEIELSRKEREIRNREELIRILPDFL